jgi:hypothetical protein
VAFKLKFDTRIEYCQKQRKEHIKHDKLQEDKYSRFQHWKNMVWQEDGHIDEVYG